jgi:hypothetical protein
LEPSDRRHHRQNSLPLEQQDQQRLDKDIESSTTLPDKRDGTSAYLNLHT